MRFKQVNDLLNYLVTVHQTIRDYYVKMEEESCQERSKLLLQFMQQCEDEACNNIRAFQDDASKAVLDTWSDAVFDADPLAPLANLEIHPYLGSDEIVSLATDVAQALIDQLERLVEEAPTDGTHETLENIITSEKNRLHKLVHSTHRLDDM
ncbi:hypothetical protein [Dongshaea marina]|uniref:hypothetical protein n=1 Tax=Dongshaea marina TaxID=2047966 RepID=UPI000D3EA295|nr:hypothetical protein [Dongshaea marina]